MKRILNKRGLIMLNLILVVSIMWPTAIFADSDIDETLRQAPDIYSEENIKETNILKSRVEEHNNKKLMARIGGNKRLSVPLYKQENSYYCGPASAQMTLSYLYGSVSQSTLARNMGTNLEQGTFVYKMVNGLNSYLGSSAYKYVSNSSISFGNGLTYSIDRGKPVICHVMTGTLPNYSATGYDTGHYVVATGYSFTASGSSGSDTVYYNDPNNNNSYYGRYSTSWSSMRRAINRNAELYIMSK